MGEHHETRPPSAFPALQHCSHYRPSGAENPQSQRGTRIHEMTASALRGELAQLDPSKNYDELQAAHWLAKETRKELSEIAGIEERLEIRDTLTGDLVTFGHCDCHGTHRLGLPGLIDWKSGQGEKGTHRAQVQIYSLGLMDKLGVTEVTASLLYCDQRRVERYTVTMEEAEALLSSTLAAQANPDSPYCAGIYCRGCTVRNTCPEWITPATKALVTLGANELQLNIEQGLESVKADPVLLGKFIHGWRRLEKLVEHADLTKAGIEYLEAGQGMEDWKVEMRRGRSHYTKDAVKQLLESGMSTDELAKLLKVDSEALGKLKPDMYLPKFELPAYKCLVRSDSK